MALMNLRDGLMILMSQIRLSWLLKWAPTGLRSLGFDDYLGLFNEVAVCQNLVPLVNIKIAGKWMFIPLKMVLIGIDPWPSEYGEYMRNIWGMSNKSVPTSQREVLTHGFRCCLGK